MTTNNIFYPTHLTPFLIKDDYIFTPICTKGYTGAQIIKIVLEKIINKENIRNPYGITADPKYAFKGEWIKINDKWTYHTSNDEDFTTVVQQTDVTLYSENDEFEGFFGFKRCDELQNVQTQIMKEMNLSKIIGPSFHYFNEIIKRVWNFKTDKKKIFILLTMDDKELDIVKKNINFQDIIVVIQSYNEVAYPPLDNENSIKPFSKEAYKNFYDKIFKYFIKK